MVEFCLYVAMYKLKTLDIIHTGIFLLHFSEQIEDKKKS
jgi:hypothetical protein